MEKGRGERKKKRDGIFTGSERKDAETCDGKRLPDWHKHSSLPGGIWSISLFYVEAVWEHGYQESQLAESPGPKVSSCSPTSFEGT